MTKLNPPPPVATATPPEGGENPVHIAIGETAAPGGAYEGEVWVSLAIIQPLIELAIRMPPHTVMEIADEMTAAASKAAKRNNPLVIAKDLSPTPVADAATAYLRSLKK